MPKHEIQEQEPADQVNLSSAESDPQEQNFQALLEQNQRLMEQMKLMGDRIARTEFAGTDKNKQRQWDEMNGQDDNIKYGHLPSFDGEMPIIDRTLMGAVGRDVYGNPIDTQVYHFTLKDGSERKVSMNDYVVALSGTPIYARCNDWMAFTDRLRVIDRKKHQFQKQGTRFRQANLDNISLMNEVKQLENENRMNVTLSLDGGRSYTGETFDIKSYMWNS